MTSLQKFLRKLPKTKRKNSIKNLNLTMYQNLAVHWVPQSIIVMLMIDADIIERQVFLLT